MKPSWCSACLLFFQFGPKPSVPHDDLGALPKRGDLLCSDFMIPSCAAINASYICNRMFLGDDSNLAGH